MDIYSQDFTVTLPDVGEGNKLNNKGILRIFQEIGCIHSSLVGLGLNDSSSNGLFWMILDWKLEVFERPIWNSKLTATTWCSGHTHIYFYRDYTLCDAAGNTVAIATSKWILFDFSKCTIHKITDDFMKNYYSDVDKHVFNSTKLNKLKEPLNSTLSHTYTVQKRDLDSNHHVNNLNYLDFAYEALPEISSCNHLEITYVKELKLGDTFNLFIAENKHSKIITMKNKVNKQLHCIIKLY